MACWRRAVYSPGWGGLPHQPLASSAQEGNGDITNDIFAPAIDG
jgi:hypothetical protein